MPADTPPPSQPPSLVAVRIDHDIAQLVDAAVTRAHRWVSATESAGSAAERRGTDRLAALMHDPVGVEFTMRFVDRVARPEDDEVAAAEFVRLVRGSAVPSFLGPVDRTLMRLGAAAARVAPRLVMPVARRRLRQLVGHLVHDAGSRRLRRALAAARAEGVQLNLNLLGEAVLGETEAQHRLERTLELLRMPEVDYISIKASSMFSQLDPWDLDGSHDRLVRTLRPLYRAARDRSRPAFLNLDMEEYKDLQLTVEVFETVMNETEFLGLAAGIVLQAYLPDAHEAMRRLTRLARTRVAAGGAPIKVRLVKGANLSMEQVDSELHDWPQAPYLSKAETDANYIRILDEVLRPELADVLRIGVASHNLFDQALAREIAEIRGVTRQMDVEMLQGMAPAQARAVQQDAGALVLYTPVVHAADFDVAVSYLVRRLEENAAAQNYLHSLFASARTPALAEQEKAFRSSVTDRCSVSSLSRRSQNRAAEALDRVIPDTSFHNQPDTDPSAPGNRGWAARALAASPPRVRSPLLTDAAQVDTVVARAVSAAPSWAAIPASDRARVLRRAGAALSRARAELLTVMAYEAGKTAAEADPEISEAIDFATYYADRALDLQSVAGAQFTPARVVVVTPPWNFPLAIPLGGVLAALAAGASVVIKPAHPTRAVAETGIAAVHSGLDEAGISRDVLQLVHTDERDAGRRLVSHPDVDIVVLTGSTETAQLFRSWRPDLHLLAETSGKNAIIVTPSADPDLAVADVVRSAFGHAGQKCSAASLVILVGPLARSKRFRRQLIDAVQSLRVGAGTDLSTTMGPLVEPPSEKLHRALTSLEPGETWLVEPRQLDETGRLWSPGLRDGVRPRSFFHTTEVFGPVLGVMTALDLDEAIRWQNAVDFGLTGGLHSLDEREIDHWLAHVQVGNAYVNRHITGAVVQRQPFGGWKASVVGPGAKAGGPNYVAQFGVWRDGDVADLPAAAIDPTVKAVLSACESQLDEADRAWLHSAAASDEAAWQDEFGIEHDPTGLRVEANIFRYRALPAIAVRAVAGTEKDIARVLLAAARTGTRVHLSLAPGSNPLVRDAVTEDDAAFAARLPSLMIERLRILGETSEVVLRAAALAGISVIKDPPVAAGRRELLTTLREQTISRTLHRFGHLPATHSRRADQS